MGCLGAADMEIAERLGRIEERLDGVHERLDGIERAIKGNGQEGLVQRTERLERFKSAIIGGLKVIGVLLSAGLLGFLATVLRLHH